MIIQFPGLRTTEPSGTKEGKLLEFPLNAEMVIRTIRNEIRDIEYRKRVTWYTPPRPPWLK